ncbi:MAG TPA: transcription-repair coupling factor [Firmicutes bacterium]|nr:transcription-repair coupling factor [Bacillota bacterium]
MKKLAGVLAPLAGAENFHKLLENLNRGRGNQFLYGLGGSQKTYLAAGLWTATGRTCLYITADLQEANNVYDDLVTLLPPERVLFFPPLGTLPYDFEAQSPEVTGQRLQVLQRLLEGEGEVMIVTTVPALQRALPPAESLQGKEVTLTAGSVLEREELLEKLLWLGYERVELVEGKGQFAVRGSIVDVFPLTADTPYRIEFFDDEVESIRQFTVEDQLSRQRVEAVRIFPARELILTPAERERGREALAQRGKDLCKRLEARGRGQLARKLRQRWEQYCEEAENFIYYRGIDNLLPLYYPDPASLLDYLPPGGVVILDEPGRIEERARDFQAQMVEIHSNLLEEGRAFPFQLENYLSWERIAAGCRRHRLLSLAHFLRSTPGVSPEDILSFLAKDVPAYQGNRELIRGDLALWQRRRYRILVFASSRERGRRLVDFLAEEGLAPALVEEGEAPREGQIQIRLGVLTRGFEFPDLKLVILTEQDLLGHQKARSLARLRPKGKKVRAVADLKPGDLVVHVNHGIGRYLGINTLEVQGVKRDYLLIQYAGEDRLYVPTDQVHLLQKYIGVEGRTPRLNKLGGAEWNRAKGKVKASVQELALELLKLYATREAVPGHAFSPDTVWQQEFEARFPYEETPDQLEAIRAVKKAMEEPKPMDYIVCGDVGYGKTEVAIRAAFKAVMDGKQVAVLVPTTILAQQHYNTFQERFAPYPVRIELLSRFRTPAQQKETIQGLKRGTVDIVIGTHRLLQRDLEFKDLGLLVIDEEQRFGVAQKEILKKLRESVDVLTLTATPIPRTLHMALAGIRDMSLIETPPENRFPVQTYVLEHDYNLVRDAITQELRRGGQVFYVHNRVETIQREAKKLQELCPQARIAVAHGQMGAGELEDITMAFLAGEYDVLVCTTIIENGLDMPNVNTLIVTNADKLGLAQLYQLRGRVGRSDRLAYAYFTYQKNKVLSADAERRLQALREFTELGSGFKLALRDLEIRGAGNLLGAEQHGHIANIGFELYCQLLEEAVRELKGQVTPPEREPVLDLNVSAYLPSDYIADGRQKIDIYKAIAAAKTREEVAELEEELRDRFGPPPRAAQNLLQVAAIKALAGKLGIEAIVQQEDRVLVELGPEPPAPLPEIFSRLKDFRRRASVVAGRKPRIAVRTRDLPGEEVLSLLIDILTSISSLAGGEGIKYNRTS